MNQQFDAVVIGAGPAGSAAAFTLASNGLTTCLIDKSDFPRDKLCGGLVTQRSKRVFETVFQRHWDRTLFTESKNIEFYSGDQFLAAAPDWIENPDYARLYFTMRRDFDSYLVDLVRHSGADLKLGVDVKEINISRKYILLSNDEQLSFRYLVGADGVNSQVAKTLFGYSFNPRTIGFGLEVEVPREHLPDHGDLVEIDFNSANWGYGWAFPKQKSITIGVGGIHRLNGDLKARLDHYLSRKRLSISNYRVKGQYIPFGDCRMIPGDGNVLLCGDAAGVVDPITGEGIAYAMHSGFFAGNAISGHLKVPKGSSAIDLYVGEYERITSSIKQANRWRYLIFPRAIQSQFAWAFSDAGTLQRGYLSILSGDLEYSALYGLLLKQGGKAARKLLRRFRSNFVRSV
ncbi:MAG: geranylgeranyl reductase family protein [Roseiarcus sp.]